VTCVAFDPERGRVRLHALDGGKQWVPFADLESALKRGVLVESETGAPFVWE
jgi:uncharacterized protein YigE (DUF2233 family)